MATEHNHSSGAVLPLTDGGIAVAQTKFAQEISIDPVTGKPVNEVTSLLPQLVVLEGENHKRHVATLVPFKDGSGFELHVDNRHVHTVKWRDR